MLSTKLNAHDRMRMLCIACLLLWPGFLIAQSTEQQVRSLLLTEMKARRIPGLQAAVIRHGRIVLQVSLGLANAEDSTPVTDRTVFPVRSVTKALTGVAILQLAEEGKVDISVPLSRYLDSLPVSWGQVTVQQLLTQTSGLPDCWDGNDRLPDYDEDLAWVKVQGKPVGFAPGKGFGFAQTNYVLLGRLIERLTGRPFTEFISARQFAVAGMVRSGFGDSRDVVTGLSPDYWYARYIHDSMQPATSLQVSLRVWPPYLLPSVGLYSSAVDLAQWALALQGGRLLSAPSLKILWTPGKASLTKDGGYAMGWSVTAGPSPRCYTASGGQKAVLAIYPDDDLAVIIVTNLLSSSPELTAAAVAKFFTR